MNIEAKKEYWANGACISSVGTDLSVYFEGVTGVSVGDGSSDLVSLRFYRTDDILGSITIPLDEATSLVTQLKQLDVYIDGGSDLDVCPF